MFADAVPQRDSIHMVDMSYHCISEPPEVMLSNVLWQHRHSKTLRAHSDTNQLQFAEKAQKKKKENKKKTNQQKREQNEEDDEREHDQKGRGGRVTRRVRGKVRQRSRTDKN